MINNREAFLDIKEKVKILIESKEDIILSNYYCGIYILYIDDFSDDKIIPFYVGQSTNISERFSKHLNQIKLLEKLSLEEYKSNLSGGKYADKYLYCKIYKYLNDHNLNHTNIKIKVLEEIFPYETNINAIEAKYINDLKSSYFGFNQINSVTICRRLPEETESDLMIKAGIDDILKMQINQFDINFPKVFDKERLAMLDWTDITEINLVYIKCFLILQDFNNIRQFIDYGYNLFNFMITRNIFNLLFNDELLYCIVLPINEILDFSKNVFSKLKNYSDLFDLLVPSTLSNNTLKTIIIKHYIPNVTNRRKKVKVDCFAINRNLVSEKNMSFYDKKDVFNFINFSKKELKTIEMYFDAIVINNHNCIIFREKIDDATSYFEGLNNIKIEYFNEEYLSKDFEIDKIIEE